MNKLRKSVSGFTLVELIVVLAILGIIFLIVVPLYPTLTQRMKVKADRTSAGNIANGVRAWSVDSSTDDLLKEHSKFLQVDTTVRLNEVPNLEQYVDVVNTKPTSLLNEANIPVPNQEYFVGMIAVESDPKVVVSVGVAGVSISDDSIENYDGHADGIIFIEQ